MTQDSNAPKAVGLYAQFQTDPDMEKTGIELVFRMGNGIPDVKIQIARAGGGNTRYNKVLEFKTKPYRRQIQTETISDADYQAIMREVYAETVILRWEGVTDREGNPLPFSKENVVQVLKDLPDLFTDIQQQANKVALFRKANLDDAAGNS